MQLELTPQDRSTLEQILERAVKEMRVEVRRTTTPAYHDQLLADRGRAQQILERIKAMAA